VITDGFGVVSAGIMFLCNMRSELGTGVWYSADDDTHTRSKLIHGCHRPFPWSTSESRLADASTPLNPDKAKRASKRKPAPLRPPPKKRDKVVALFTFVVTSDLMLKELAAFRKQETRIELTEVRWRKVEYA
jgi:hypothetical protein